MKESDLAVLESQIVKTLGIARVKEIKLTNTPTGIVIGGVVTSYYAKQLAQHIVLARDLCISENRLQVLVEQNVR